MKLANMVIETWVANNRAAGRSEQEIEDDFKFLLKSKQIDVDDYSYAMEIIYEEVK